MLCRQVYFLGRFQEKREKLGKQVELRGIHYKGKDEKDRSPKSAPEVAEIWTHEYSLPVPPCPTLPKPPWIEKGQRFLGEVKALWMKGLEGGKAQECRNIPRIFLRPSFQGCGFDATRAILTLPSQDLEPPNMRVLSKKRSSLRETVSSLHALSWAYHSVYCFIDLSFQSPPLKGHWFPLKLSALMLPRCNRSI